MASSGDVTKFIAGSTKVKSWWRRLSSSRKLGARGSVFKLYGISVSVLTNLEDSASCMAVPVLCPPLWRIHRRITPYVGCRRASFNPVGPPPFKRSKTQVKGIVMRSFRPL